MQLRTNDERSKLFGAFAVTVATVVARHTEITGFRVVHHQSPQEMICDCFFLTLEIHKHVIDYAVSMDELEAVRDPAMIVELQVQKLIAECGRIDDREWRRFVKQGQLEDDRIKQRVEDQQARMDSEWFRTW